MEKLLNMSVVQLMIRPVTINWSGPVLLPLPLARWFIAPARCRINAVARHDGHGALWLQRMAFIRSIHCGCRVRINLGNGMGKYTRVSQSRKVECIGRMNVMEKRKRFAEDSIKDLWNALISSTRGDNANANTTPV